MDKLPGSSPGHGVGGFTKDDLRRTSLWVRRFINTNQYTIMITINTSDATIMKGSVKGNTSEQVVSQLVDLASNVVKQLNEEQRNSLAVSLVVMAMLEDVPKEALREPLSAMALCAQCGLYMGEAAKRKAKENLAMFCNTEGGAE